MVSRFDAAYEGEPPWDIGRPQPEVQAIDAEGGFAGHVLDAGCGTGENALFLAARGHDVVGIDFAEPAIERAEAKARGRGVSVDFRVWDALDLPSLSMRFDAVLDSGLFHVFDDDERSRYVESLAGVVTNHGRFHVLCFSEHEPPGWGPRRVTQAQIRDAFASGWRVEDIRPARFDVLIGSGSVRAWRATVRRVA